MGFTTLKPQEDYAAYQEPLLEVDTLRLHFVVPIRVIREVSGVSHWRVCGWKIPFPHSVLPMVSVVSDGEVVHSLD
jgi:hypothetical protein